MNEPACRFCREKADSYYMTCPGCQVRRKKAWEAYQNRRSDSGKPEPSQPQQNTKVL